MFLVRLRRMMHQATEVAAGIAGGRAADWDLVRPPPPLLQVCHCHRDFGFSPLSAAAALHKGPIEWGLFHST